MVVQKNRLDVRDDFCEKLMNGLFDGVVYFGAVWMRGCCHMWTLIGCLYGKGCLAYDGLNFRGDQQRPIKPHEGMNPDISLTISKHRNASQDLSRRESEIWYMTEVPTFMVAGF